MSLLLVSISIASALIFQGEPIPHQVEETRGLIAEVDESGSVTLFAGEEDPNHPYRWVISRDFTKKGGADLSSHGALVTTIENRSFHPVETMLWVCGKNGWAAVGDFAQLQPNEVREFRVNLWETYPDGTLKIDARHVDRLQIMVRGVKPDLELRVEPFQLEGPRKVARFQKRKVHVPTMSEGAPAPGKRAKFHPSGGAYAVLYLPPSWREKPWREGDSYPVIVEFPGNIFCSEKCYSTGRPEQCVIGYGMSEGKDSIILSLPFVDASIADVVESGFGNPEETVAYAKAAIEKVLKEFGGDRENMVLTGFSRGSIACGFIGLRDAEIAAYWKGIHGCQHYDGSDWRESNMEDAVERAKRFQGEAIFQTDNRLEKYRPVVEATDPGVRWTWAESGLGFHATAMFLDDRPSTVQLRRWYRDLVGLEQDATGLNEGPNPVE